MRWKGRRESANVEDRRKVGGKAAIGDDTLQKQSQGHVVPDAFTHGTSEQRMKWFRRGLQARSLREGDTFQARDL